MAVAELVLAHPDGRCDYRPRPGPQCW